MPDRAGHWWPCLHTTLHTSRHTRTRISLLACQLLPAHTHSCPPARPAAVGALLAFYIVRRRKRQRLADAEQKGFGSARHGMAEGEVDDFLDTSSFPIKPAEAAVAATGGLGTAGSYPHGSMPLSPGTPTAVTASGTSEAAGTSRWAQPVWKAFHQLGRTCFYLQQWSVL